MEGLRNPRVSKTFFLLSAFLILLFIEQQIEEPYVFLCFGGGFVLFTYFLRRAIWQVTET